MGGARWLRALAAGLLVLALCWRMVGAPVSAAQWRGLETEAWQARVLAPARAKRMLQFWTLLPPKGAQAADAALAAGDADAEALRALTGETAEQRTVRVFRGESGAVETMELERYVCGVVAAEAPASYHLEALMAQAVAARTRVAAQLLHGGCAAHPDADICDDSAHCQGYAGEAACRALWGDAYEAYRARVLDAVERTRDEIVTWDGLPITVLYHAISGGQTEDAQAVFAEALPYLVSVESAGEESAPGFAEEMSLTLTEAARLLADALPGLHVDADTLRRELLIAKHTQSGRVQTLLVGGAEVPATVFRRALGLRSTWFTISTEGDKLCFSQRGYGHGVGMSQAGANAMAARGADYRAILRHYYPGTQIEALARDTGT